MKYAILISTLFLLGCRPSPDYSAELAALQRQRDSLRIVASIRHDSIEALQATVERQRTYVAYLDSLRGVAASEAASARKTVLDYEGTTDSLALELNRIYRQLAGGRD